MRGEPETVGSYLYCIIRDAKAYEFATRGIGEQGDIVHLISLGDLAAVVSDSPTAEYERSRRNMMAHTLVLEEALQHFTLLPVRFGTVAPNEEAVRTQLLERRHNEFDRLLTEMEGRVELGLKVVWYENVILEEMVAEDATLRELRDSMVGRPPAETHFGRLRLGEMLEAAMGRRRREEGARILGRLSPLALKTRENPLHSDRMVLNAAFLVKAEDGADFDRALERLDSELAHRLIFKYVGPTAPYNFVNISVVWDGPLTRVSGLAPAQEIGHGAARPMDR